ncbi:MAG TPA: hypothetical protein VIJ09_10700, partial [Acidimicrobiales bacterium]
IAPHFHSLGDTHVGGSVLWVVGELTSLVALGIVLYQWMQYEERQAVRADRRSDAEEAAASLSSGTSLSSGAATPAHNGKSGLSGSGSEGR